MSEIVESEERKATQNGPRSIGLSGDKDALYKQTSDMNQQVVQQKYLRLDSTCTMSNQVGVPSDPALGPPINNSFKLKRGTQVPESFLVPMALRKTKRKQSLSPGSIDMKDMHSSSIVF